MRQAFLQFCVANRKHFQADCFGHDQYIGTYPVNITVVAAFLSFLRYKGRDLTSADVKKVSTIHNQWLEVKQGLLAAMAPATIKPEWLVCSPKQNIHGKLYEPGMASKRATIVSDGIFKGSIANLHFLYSKIELFAEFLHSF